MANWLGVSPEKGPIGDISELGLEKSLKCVHLSFFCFLYSVYDLIVKIKALAGTFCDLSTDSIEDIAVYCILVSESTHKCFTCSLILILLFTYTVYE